LNICGFERYNPVPKEGKEVKIVDFTEFVGQIADLLRERNDKLDISIQTVRKNNSVQYTGLSIRAAGANVTPIIYLEPFFQRYEEYHDMEEVIDRIMKIYQQNEFHFDADSIMDFNNVKDRIIYIVVNRHKNKEMLNEVPNRVLVEDIAVVYKIMLDDAKDGSTASIQIKNSMMDIWSVDEETLWTCAQENNKRLKKPECRSMYEVLLELMIQRHGIVNDELIDGIRTAEPRMYILRDESGQYGASVIADMEFMYRVYDDIGEFYILPSSLHEVIAIPVRDEYEVAEMTSMVAEVNRTQLTEEEILADMVYKFDGKSIKVA